MVLAEKEFSPDKFVDRTGEREAFEELLTLASEARILAIADSGDMGKTHLLEQLHFRCRSERVPAAMVALDQLSTAQPLDFVQTIQESLSDNFDLPFPTYLRVERARAIGDFSTIENWINLQGSNFAGASDVRFANEYYEKVEVHGDAHFSQPAAAQLSPSQDRIAREEALKAFFHDLREICAERTVVLLIDAFEKCDQALRRWLLSPFLQRHFFDLGTRPKRLVLVVAGREMPPFGAHWSPADIEAVVHSTRQLGKWSRQEIDEVLEVNGYRFGEVELNAFYAMAEARLPPGMIVKAMQISRPTAAM